MTAKRAFRMKTIQVIVFVLTAWFLIYVRDNTPDPLLREPLGNGLLIGLLSAGAAFVVTIVIIGLTELLSRLRGRQQAKRL
jgi:ABC-type Fe3+ transport system permease subunit